MRFIPLLLLFAVITHEGMGQELVRNRTSDSLSLRDLTFPQPGQQLMQPVVLLPIDFADSATVRNLPPGYLKMVFLSRSDHPRPMGLLSPLRFQTNQRNPWRIVTTALEVIYAGGTAYLTYQALKKYGYIR